MYIKDMIEIRVRAIAESRGIRNAHALAALLQVSPSVAARLWSGDFRRVDVATLDRLCAQLRVQPGSLFRFSRSGKPEPRTP